MVTRKSVFALLVTIGGLSAVIFGYVGVQHHRAAPRQPADRPACLYPDSQGQNPSAKPHGKIRPPADLSIDLAGARDVGAPLTVVVTALSQIPVSGGVITLKVPAIGAETARSEVLWSGTASGFVSETLEYVGDVLPPGRYQLVAVFEFAPAGENAQELALSKSLYLDVRPTTILSSNVSFDQIKRIELWTELEERVLLSMRPGLATADRQARDRELALIEARDPGIIARKIAELRLNDPDVARRIMELNLTKVDTTAAPGGDNLLVYDTALNPIDFVSGIGNPTHLASPGSDIRYPQLNIIKTVLRGASEGPLGIPAVAAGGTMTYGITVENDENFAVTEVVVVDGLPDEVSLMPADANTAGGKYDPLTHAYTWSYPLLESGAAISLELVVNVNPDVAAGTIFTNFVTINSNETPPCTTSVEVHVVDLDPVGPVGPGTPTPPGTVCGQIRYQDREGKEHPVRYSRVKVYEADENDNPLDDHQIGQWHTDATGKYSIILQNTGQSGREIYVKVFAQGIGRAYPKTTSRICRVRDDVFNEVYCLQSPLYPHPGDSFTVIDMVAPISGGEFMVYDSVVEGFAKAKTFFGVDLAEIVVYWPSSDDGTYCASSGIFISRDDRGDRDVIMHEYGHYIADVYNFAQGPVGNNPAHRWNLDLRRWPVLRGDNEARNLAFRESWASLFSIATQYGDTRYPNSGDTKYQDVDEGVDDPNEKVYEDDLESDDDELCTPGEFYENMNCCALWDIFDEESSDGYLDLLSDTSLSKIWTTTREYKPDDIIDFWNSWFRNYDYEREMKYIFRNHEMPFAVPNL